MSLTQPPIPPRDERIETLEMKVLNLEQMIRTLQVQLKPHTDAKLKPKLRATPYPLPKFKGRARYMKLD